MKPASDVIRFHARRRVLPLVAACLTVVVAAACGTTGAPVSPAQPSGYSTPIPDPNQTPDTTATSDATSPPIGSSEATTGDSAVLPGSSGDPAEDQFNQFEQQYFQQNPQADPNPQDQGCSGC
jgi:hypothetical protein